MKWALLLACVACRSSPSRIDPMLVDRSPAVASEARTAATRGKAFTEPIISIGRDGHACAVRRSGHVDCWGRRGLGRASPEIERVPDIDDALAIDARARCVLRRSGRVGCFTARLALADQGVSDVVALASGRGDCFLHRDGSVTCRDYGRLPSVPDAVAITRTADVACVVTRAGAVSCLALDSARTDAAWHPLASLGRVRRFELGTTYRSDGCAITHDGQAHCFLMDRSGKHVADFGKSYNSAPPIELAAIANATDLAIGEAIIHGSEHRVIEAIVDGKLVQWNDRDGKTRVLPGVEDAAQLVVGCALRLHGPVVCWGSNAGGALGHATTIGRVRQPPRPVVGLNDVAQLALGFRHSYARTHDGELFYWGSAGRAIPTLVPRLPAMARITDVAVDSDGLACVVAGGGAWCRGARPSWQDGLGWRAIASRDVVSVAVSTETMFALRGDGSIVRVAVREQAGALEPLAAPPDSIALVASKYGPCVRTRAGGVICHERQAWQPTPLEGSAVAIGGIVRCEIRAGVAACWRTTFDRGHAPVELAPFTTAIDVAVNDDRSCVALADGKVVCWVHDHEQKTTTILPDGAVAVELAVEPDDGLEPGLVRNSHGCAIMKDRTVTCWGGNVRGELGDGSLDYTATPISVPGL